MQQQIITMRLCARFIGTRLCFTLVKSPFSQAFHNMLLLSIGIIHLHEVKPYIYFKKYLRIS